MTRRRRQTSPRQALQASAARLEVWETDYPMLGNERPRRDLLAAFVLDDSGQVAAEWHSEPFRREVEHHGIVYGGRVLRPARYIALLVQLIVGLRFSELRALEKKDLDLSADGLWVRRSVARKTVSTPKNKKARFHPVPAALIEELQRWMLKTEGQLLFPGPEGGRLSNNTLNRWFTELAAEAGIRRISSHGAGRRGAVGEAVWWQRRLIRGQLRGNGGERPLPLDDQVWSGSGRGSISTSDLGGGCSPRREFVSSLSPTAGC
jgi:integrase